MGIEKMSTGTVFNIQRFSLHDGPGIRTTVFLKGCPLRCRWCHNPESLSPKPQLSLMASRCMGCGRCREVCPQGVHQEGKMPNYAACIACGACAEACPTTALELLGKTMTAEEVLTEVVKDKAFYARSGGGLTLSGGEPAMQPEFALEVLKGARAAGVHTAIETAGHIDWKVYESFLPYLDMVLFDIKHMDPQKHKELTGQDNLKIHSNLRQLTADDKTVEVIVRTPVIPGCNDDPSSFEALAAFLHSLDRTPTVNVLPYNPLAGSKHPRLGMEYSLEGTQEADGVSPDTLCAQLCAAGIEAKVLR